MACVKIQLSDPLDLPSTTPAMIFDEIAEVSVQQRHGNYLRLAKQNQVRGDREGNW